MTWSRLTILTARLLGILAFAVLIAGIYWAWQEGLPLERARRAALVLAAVALVRGVSGVLQWIDDRRDGPPISGDGPFTAALACGLPAIAFLALLGIPASDPPGTGALRVALAVSIGLSIMAAGMAGVAIFLAAWATRMRDYLLGQMYIQGQVLSMLAVFLIVAMSVRAVLQ